MTPTKQTVSAPPYYKEFACIADRCRHSCCIDWEICIDDCTLDKYRAYPDIWRTVTECDGERCFALDEHGRCPHLTEQGLCSIILHHGEAYLSNICRRHPRFFNTVAPGVTEAGLGLVCEQACRMILTDERPFSLVCVDEAPDESDADTPTYDARPARADMLKVIQSEASFSDVATALRKRFALPVPYTDEQWLDRLAALESLDPAWAPLLHAAKKAPQADVGTFDPHLKRLLTCFIYRHVSVAHDTDDLRARLGFCLLSTELVRRLLQTQQTRTVDTLIDLARRYSSEIEYSIDNTDELIFAFACAL